MKIALLTFVNNLNFGGSLQLYALERALEIRYPYYDYEYLNYNTDKKISTIKWFTNKIKAFVCRTDDNPSWKISEFIKIISNTAKENASQNSSDLFEKFWKMSNYSHKLTRKDILKAEKEYDLFIVGSDQVWNCGRLDLDTTYLLDFVSDSNKKCSYASSLAMEQIPNKYRDKYYKYLSRFTKISCRERSGAKLLTEFLNRDVKSVVDPVFLLNIDEWKNVMDKELSQKLSGEKYILIYQLETNSTAVLERLAKKIKGKDWTIKKISGNLSDNDRIGPSQWLSLFYNASMVLTDSFHGTAFSLKFEKQFYSYIPDGDFFKASSSRIVDLLEGIGLTNRIYNTEKNCLDVEYIKYNNVRGKINNMISESEKYLDSIMGEITNVKS